MSAMNDVIRLMDAMAESERLGRMFGTSHFATAVQREPMQATSAAHAIGAALRVAIEVMDAERVNLNDLQHPSPIRDRVAATRDNGWRTIFVLRGPSILANDRRIPILAGMIGARASLILAVDGDPPRVPSQVVCDLRRD